MIAVLFDMDGTLLDLTVEIEAVRAELGELFRPLGYDGPFRPILRCIEDAATAVARDQEHRETLVRRARALIDDAEVRAAAQARRRAGARQTVRRLAAAGIPFGLITDNGRACVPVALRAAELHDAGFREQAISTRDEGPPKPAPHGVERCAKQLLPRGGRLWYVGDSVRDVEAGRRAASRLARGEAGTTVAVVTAAVLGGRSPAKELRAAQPDHLLGGLSELWSLEPWHVR